MFCIFSCCPCVFASIDLSVPPSLCLACSSMVKFAVALFFVLGLAEAAKCRGVRPRAGQPRQQDQLQA